MSTPMDRPVNLSWRRFLLPPMHVEGRRFVGAAAALALAGGLLWAPLGLVGLLLAVAVYRFFRDPERVPPADPRVVVSPADGMVCQIAYAPLPSELELGPEFPSVWKISVFMSVLDVHVNRMPASGKALRIRHVAGRFFNASLDKASAHNERCLYLVELPDGRKLAFAQIAGLVARRIVGFVREGDMLACGQRVGLIRFGSRVEVYLPPGVEPCARLGQTMVAGETRLAVL